MTSEGSLEWSQKRKKQGVYTLQIQLVFTCILVILYYIYSILFDFSVCHTVLYCTVLYSTAQKKLLAP